jgi:hypothetical protein
MSYSHPVRGEEIMPVAEIAASITSLRATMDIAKAMINLRDAEAFRAKSIELQETIMRALDSGIEAREAYAKQLDAVRTLEAEVARLEAWDAEKQRYELKSVGTGAVAYVLKPDARGTETPHFLCPNCFHQRKKSFFQSDGKMELRRLILKCADCKATIAVTHDLSKWPE